ncbi:uncharacterized protein SCHCODRAFT_01104110 [Schizophyllum commune H4-8]|nr:uncharacterized protein SCHCODRAFT_01104110 [Schizophyllum commune H4-8]KAI5887570.1 hypothetical protein SCHCODRAFT_01104110 [Schizophyllum commune H4-8]
MSDAGDKRLPPELVTSIVREVPPDDQQTLGSLYAVHRLRPDVVPIYLHTIELACSLSTPWIDERRAGLPYKSYLELISDEGVVDIADVLLREPKLRRHVRKLFLGWPNDIANDGQVPNGGEPLSDKGPQAGLQELLGLLTRLRAVDFVAEGPRKDTALSSLAPGLVQLVATQWQELRSVGLTGWKVSADECRAMLRAVGEAMKLEELCLTECICDGAVLICPDDLGASERPYALIMTYCDYASRLAELVCEALGRPKRIAYHPPVRRVIGAPRWAFEVGNISELVEELDVEVNVDRVGEWGLAPPDIDIVLDTKLRRFRINILHTVPVGGVETHLWKWLSALASYLCAPSGCAAAITVSARGVFPAMATWSAFASRREGVVLCWEDHVAVGGHPTDTATARVSKWTTDPTWRIRTFELLGYDTASDRIATEGRVRALRHRLRGLSASHLDLPALICPDGGRADHLEFLGAYAADDDSDANSTHSGQDGARSPVRTGESDDCAQAWEEKHVHQLPSKVRQLVVSLDCWRTISTRAWTSLVLLALQMDVPDERCLPLPPLPQLQLLSLHLPVKPRRSLGTYACRVYPHLKGLAIGRDDPALSTLHVICGTAGGRMRSLAKKFDDRWVYADWAGLQMTNLRVVLWRGIMLVRKPNVGWGCDKAFEVKNRRLRDWQEGGERVAEYSSYGIADVCEVLGL